MFPSLAIVIAIIAAFFILAMLAMMASFYKKVIQGQAIVRTGVGGTKIAFEQGIFVFPVIHRAELMDISLKKVEIERLGKDGLICMDNLRADIKVVFFVRVNRSTEDVVKVASTIGCERSSSPETLVNLFEAKFSEALKTVGKQFDFVDLYNSREVFKQKILEVIGRDLNGYILDDAAIDYLEQTPIEHLKDNNILDVQGIKKITELTAIEKIKANQIRRDEEKTIKHQNVVAREAILELERQLAEKEEIQKREIANIKSREEAEIAKVAEEEKLKSERARIAAQEEIEIAEENKQRQVILALKQKERIQAIETEKVEKDRLLEVTEREKVVELAQIEKEKALEEERKQIQDVIRERIAVEKTVVEEEEKIKDTKALAEAERSKQVAIKQAEQLAQEDLVTRTRAAEADKIAAEMKAKQLLIDAEAAKQAALKDAEATKILAEAKAAEEAAIGISEAQVIEAKANASEREGTVNALIVEKKAKADAIAIEVKALAEAKSIEAKAVAEATGIEAKAKAEEHRGLMEAKVLEEKGKAEAKSIQEKAEAMKQLDGVGKEHEEFKLRLEKAKEVELAGIEAQKDIAVVQSDVMAEALKSTNIDIVGGETMFFENIMKAVSRGKAIDTMIDNSKTLGTLKEHILNGEGTGGENPIDNIRAMIGQFGLSTNDVKNLTISALLLKMSGLTDDLNMKEKLNNLLSAAESSGLANTKVKQLGI